MSTIRFETKLFKIDDWTILRLPQDASAQLPSRGQTMVKGAIDEVRFQTALEPDGKGSHWLRVDQIIPGAAAGDTVTMAIEPTKDWPEPNVPKDLQSALSADGQAYTLWTAVTPMARWDWIRWIGDTKNPETRKRRIEVTFSKLKAGTRRPCCFNRSACTEPYVASGGKLREPTQ